MLGLVVASGSEELLRAVSCKCTDLLVVINALSLSFRKSNHLYVGVGSFDNRNIGKIIK